MRNVPGILLAVSLLLAAAGLGGCGARDVAADKVLVRGGASATASASATSSAGGTAAGGTAAGGVAASGGASVDAPAVEKELSAIEHSLDKVSMPSDTDLKDIDAATR